MEKVMKKSTALEEAEFVLGTAALFTAMFAAAVYFFVFLPLK